MDSASKKYYRNTMFLLSMVGVGPYQNKLSRCLVFLVYFFVAGSQFYCKIAYMVLAWPDIHLIIQCAPPIFVDVISIIKLLNCIIQFKKIKKIFDQLIFFEDQSLSSEEVNIMENHAENGRKFTIIWLIQLPRLFFNFPELATMYSILMTYMSLPLLPQILGTLGNDTKQLPLPVYYHGVDIQEYFYPIFLHAYFTGFVFVTSLIAADTMYVIFVERSCALFEIVSYRLRNAVKPEYNNFNPSIHDDVPYKNFVDCVKRHRTAIKFAEEIEASHTTAFLLAVGTNMLIISVTGVELMANTDKLHHFLRHGAMVAGQMSHLFIENNYAQKLLDHSIGVYENIFRSHWYNTSLRTKKLLCLFTMRSLTPSALTTGGFYVMSIDNFAMLLRTSVSYFTLLRSFQ